VKAVSFDEVGRVKKIEPFAQNIEYAAPIDSRFGPDGNLYVLEYGKAWFKGNPEAALSRIEFVGSGNRPPSPLISLDRKQGAVPFKATATAEKSLDLDGDQLTYNWSLKPLIGTLEAKKISDSVTAELELDQPGKYLLTLTATDSKGASASVETELQMGNEPAKIDISFSGNNSFYWPNTQNLSYKIRVEDAEDGVVASDDANLVINFTFASGSLAAAEGHQQADNAAVAQELMRANGCKSCHAFDTKVVGPAFNDVAQKYKADKNAVNYLVNKMGKGGNGVWGELNMPAFASLSETDRTSLAKFVLSLANKPKPLPLVGVSAPLPTFNLDAQKKLESNEEPLVMSDVVHKLNVAYSDKGASSIGSIKAIKQHQLQPARLGVAFLFNPMLASKNIEPDKFKDRPTVKVPATANWLAFSLGQYDLTGIARIRLGFYVKKQGAQWQFELRQGSDSGVVLAAADNLNRLMDVYLQAVIKINPSIGFNDLYLAVRSTEKSDSELHLYDVSFLKN
jgi:cytochrome c